MVDKAKSDLAKAMTAYCVRNTSLENMHAGKLPITKTGDYSDVFIIDSEGNKFTWKESSHISQEEMKVLMKTVVNRIYDVLIHKGDKDFEKNVLDFALKYTKKWDDPEPIKHGDKNNL